MPVTQSGMREARAAIERLAPAVRASLRSVAQRTALRIRDGARHRLLAQTQGTGRTAAAIAVREDPDEKAFAVESKAVRPSPANLPLWLEFGTVHMTARPYMRPAVEAESDRYVSELRDASGETVREVMG